MRRARISSQCLKRAIRETFKSEKLIGKEYLAERTKRLVDSLVSRLKERGKNEDEARRVREAGIVDVDKKYTLQEMASGSVMFAATGVTNGDLLTGVRFFKGGGTSNSVVMRSRTLTVRYIEAIHRFDLKPEY